MIPADAEAGPATKATYHRDRPSARTPDEREGRYQAWIARQAPYVAAVEAAGDVPWFRCEDKLAKLGLSGLSEDEARRQLFGRRYAHAQAPAL